MSYVREYLSKVFCFAKAACRDHWVVLVLSLLLIVVKMKGATWGFPGYLHNDESNMVRSALGMRFGDLNPGHFDWPSLSFYFHYFIFMLFIKLRILLQLLFGTEQLKAQFPFWWGGDLPFLFIGRLTSIVLTAVSGLLVYAITLQITAKNKTTALTAFCIFAVGYWINFMSFYALPDILLVLLSLISFYFSLKIVENPTQIYNYAFAGTFAGLAASTKYHAVLFCIVLLIAHLLNNFAPKALFDRKLVVGAFCAIAGFIVGTPYSVLDLSTFMVTENATGAMWQMSHMGHAANWDVYLFKVIPQTFGFLALFAGMLGIYVALVSRNKKMFLLIATLGLLVLYIGSWGIARPHYGMLFFPQIAILCALGLNFLSQKLKLSNWLYWLCLTVLLIQPVYSSSIEIYKRSKEHTQVLAGKWINQNVPLGSTIVMNFEKVGIYGGNAPIFDYNKYNVLSLDPVGIQPDYIVLPWGDLGVKRGKIVYSTPQDLRLGEDFIIIKTHKH